MQLSDSQRAHLVELARRTICNVMSGEGEKHTAAISADSTAQLDIQHPAGCFVSLHEAGTQRLRGCVGCLEAKDSLATAVEQAALSVLHDPRFLTDPVRRDELPKLEIEITLLSPMIDAIDPLDFDPVEHGIFLTIGKESGCFLPQVARETGWSREQLLDRLCTEKLGLPRDAWKAPNARLQRFSATILGPERFFQ
ncbi:TIGR00296 family protein [soil metagenome]